jgi:signal transduction histidine kinase
MKLVLLLLLLFARIGYAQQHEIDSLRSALDHEKTDTGRAIIFCNLELNFGYVNYDSSMMYAQKALRLSQDQQFLYGQFLAYLNQFFTHNVIADYPKTLEVMLKSLEIAERLPNRQDASIKKSLFFIGFVYREMGDFGKAIANHTRALALARQRKILELSDYTMISNLANSYLFIGNKDSAKYWEDSLMVSVNNRKRPRGLAGPCRYEMALGNYAAAEAFGRETISNYFANRHTDNGYFLAGYYKDMAQVMLYQKKFDSAIQYAQLGMKLSEEKHFLHYAMDAANALSSAYLSKKLPDSAVRYLGISISRRDSIFNQNRVRQFQLIGFTEEQRQKEIALAQERYRNQVKVYGLIAAMLVFLLIAFILYRNNRQKQTANTLLNAQKREIEQTLSTLRSTQQQLIQSEKMASLGELTAGIAHEIQNPLNFVNNFSEINTELLNDLKGEISEGNLGEANSIAENIISNEQKISQHGKRAESIVRSMLQHSRPSAGKLELVDINSMADEYLRIAYHGYRAKDHLFKVSLQSHYDPNVGKVNANAQEIGRVILNLLNNAFYSVSEKKKILNGDYDPSVSIETYKYNGRTEIIVKDNGQGIPAKIAAKIFQPFFTTKPAGQGTGLGLSLSYDIIKAHGGDIKVETQEGIGTAFTITLQ